MKEQLQPLADDKIRIVAVRKESREGDMSALDAMPSDKGREHAFLDGDSVEFGAFYAFRVDGSSEVMRSDFQWYLVQFERSLLDVNGMNLRTKNRPEPLPYLETIYGINPKA
jgi:hypothetical protein